MSGPPSVSQTAPKTCSPHELEAQPTAACRAIVELFVLSVAAQPPQTRGARLRAVDPVRRKRDAVLLYVRKNIFLQTQAVEYGIPFRTPISPEGPLQGEDARRVIIMIWLLKFGFAQDSLQKFARTLGANTHLCVLFRGRNQSTTP